MKKKLGNVIKNDKDYTPIWASVYNHKDTILMTIFFTQDYSPQGKEWFMPLVDMGFKTLKKGTLRYGYYYKILVTKKLDNMQELLDQLNKNKYDNTTFDIKYSAKDMYRKFVLEKI